MQRKWPHPGRQHSSQGPQRASTCLDELHERSQKSPRGRCESESEGQMQKRKPSVIQITSFFSADGETRTLARQCLAVHVSPQSGIRLTAPRGRCESESGAEYKKRKLSVVQITSFSVRMVRLELTQANAHYPLKVACLPFHHIRR